jgi:phosphatidylserine decarboxylase
MSIAREGWPYIGALVLSGFAAVVFGFPLLAFVPWVLGLFTAFFFRDPERAPPPDPRLVVSPADGRIVQVRAAAPEALGPGATQVSIFLSIFNVHVNRAPIAGQVAGVEYRKGAFLPAFDDKASLRNEQNRILLEDGSLRIAFTQIAGLIARRIVFRKRLHDFVERGERVGLIKFGSRVDVFLPPHVRILVKVGDHVQGGSSPIGERS